MRTAEGTGRRHRVGRRTPGPCLLLAVVLLLMAGVSPANAQLPTVRLDLPTDPAETDERINIAVTVDDVTNLGAFEFRVAFEPAVLQAEEVEPGPFLGSSGREVNCLPANIEEGSVRLVCVTLGATPAGPTGSGVLGTVSFKALQAGVSPLRFERLLLTDPPGQQVAAASEDASITVVVGASNGFAWALWAPIIGGAVAALAAAGGFAWWTRRSR